MSSLERDHVHSSRPVAAKEVPLVDRTEEMNVLKEAIYRAVHGEGGLVFVHGEAGIGKTRLVRELGAYAQSRGVQVLYGRCPALFRMNGVPPYIIWKEIIKDYLETCTPEQLYRVIGYYPAEVAKLVPEISQKLRSIPQSFPISPEQEQNRLFEAVSQFITNISRETPLLVVLDDLQWTDPSSLLLLHYLARGVQKSSLLLLGAYRSADIDAKHPLTPVVAELKRERLPQFLPLKRMSPENTSEIIRQILEQDDIPPEFCKLVYDKTRGNPFFVEEVIESLKEEGVIYREQHSWKVKEVSEIEFPETVKNVVKARIGRLDDECQSVLTMASFVGNDFNLEAMCAVTGMEKNKLLELLDRMFKTGLIKERVIRGEGICSFADILVRDVVYEEVSPLKRNELHGVVGCALEKIYSQKMDEHFGELASHFLESGDKDKAFAYFLKAGEKARKVYANTEEVSYLKSALRLLEEKEGKLEEKASVLERLGDVEQLIGENDNCLRHWNEALPLWAKLQKRDTTATLHRKMANVLWETLGDKKTAKEHHEAALEILETEPESVELARLYEDMAHMQRRMGVAEALPLAEKALALAEKLNALEVIALSCIELSLDFRFSASALPVTDVKKGLEYANRALKIALENEYWETALWAYSRLGESMLPLEEYEKRKDNFEKGLALAKKIGHVNWQFRFRADQAFQYMMLGELEKAIAALEEALAMSKRTGSKFDISFNLVGLGEACRMLGEWERSEQYLREASETARGQDEFVLAAYVHEDLGMLHLDEENYVKAKESFEEALKIWEKAGLKFAQMTISVAVSWALIELGELEKAQSLLDNVQSFALETDEKPLILWSIGLRAMLLRAQKKFDESVELFEKALKEWESLKANIWHAYNFARWVLVEYARACLERNVEGDKERAVKLLNRALDMFQKMGAKKDIEKVEAKLLYIETGKVASVPKRIELIATGYTDLDKLLCGGIRSSSAVVLTSPSFNERDLLVKSFLETGAEKGEATFYITIDPSGAKTLAEEFSNFYLFVCNPQADAIVKEAPNIYTLKGVENLTDINIALTSAIRKLDPMLKGSRRICIGLISDVLLQHHAVQTRRWLASLMTELKSNGFTTLVTMNPQMHPSQEFQAVLDLFEGQIDIYEKETESGSEKFLKIKKMANQRYLKDELLLKEEDMQEGK